MLLAAYLDAGYKTVLFIHIVTAIVAVAPAVVHPILFEFEKRRDGGDVAAFSSRVAATSRIYAIAMLVSGVVGFGLISMSDSVIEWGDTWVWLSIVVWIAINAVLHAVIFPAEKALAGGDESAFKKIERFGPMVGFGVLVLVYLMTIKPGGGF
jgi:uncharacterized membrane protein